MALIQQDVDDHVAKIILLILNIIWWIVLTPICAYHARSFWLFKNREIPFFSKRHPKLVLFIVVLCLLYPIIIRPPLDYSFFYLSLEWQYIMITIGNMIQLFVIPTALRIHLLYIDYNSAQYLLSIKWKSQIISRKYKLPWYVKYKWVADIKQLSVNSCIIAVIMITFIIVIGATLDKLAVILWNIVGVCFAIFTIAVAYNVRSCRDEFSIQREFILIAVTLCVVIISWFGLVILFEPRSNIRIIGGNILSVSACYFVCFIQTFWVIKQYVKQLKLEDLERAVSDSSDTVHLGLEGILSERDGFDLFANHLVKEFSIENLFFVFEMIQIKHEVINNNLLNDEKYIGVMVKIERYILNELRRENSNICNIKQLKENLKYIMKQYIDLQSKYSINISGIIRSDINEKYVAMNERWDRCNILDRIDFVENDNNNNDNDKIEEKRKDEEFVKEYITMFDEAMEGIICLLRLDSLPRFYDTQQYQKWVATIH